MITNFFILLSLLHQSRSVNCDISFPNLDNYNDYLVKYNKHYETPEFWYRYYIYRDNLQKIDIHNKNHSKTYTLGINKFTDMSISEFKNLYLGYSKGDNRVKNSIYHKKTGKNIPDSIDWRASGIVTPVKDQKACGSCWAFSAIGSIEGQHAKKTKNLVSLSEQNLVDCAFSTGNYGCEGGWPEAAMEYVINNHGVDTEDSYPYIGLDGTCNFSNKTVGAQLSKTVNITHNSMECLYDAIASIGPISVAIDAEDDFQFYSSGIYTSDVCDADSLNHAVLAVGYGIQNNNKYIIVKNSWGSDWGMDGYIYMSTDVDNLCGIASDASYPIV